LAGKPVVSGSVGYPLGFVAAVTVTVLAVAAHATSHPLWSVAALAVPTAAIAAVTTLPAALATAGVCWALHAGFVLGRHGDLQFSSASAAAAALLVAVAVVVHAVGVVVRAGLRANRRPVAIPTPRAPGTPRLRGSHDGSALA